MNDGYDVTDFYGVDPRLGTPGDFAELVHQAGNRGLRVIIDLVVDHTSDEHQWFRSARSDAASPYRDWYVWSQEEPSDRRQGMVFPGRQGGTWTWDDEAAAWYYSPPSRRRGASRTPAGGRRSCATTTRSTWAG